MQLITGTTKFHIEAESIVAIGKFDGIHRGHQKLINQVLKGKELGLKAVLFTFDPPPASFFANKKLKELTTTQERRKRFEEMGIDVLIEFPLNEMTAAMAPEVFVERILVKSIHAKMIVAGTDLTFGYKGLGNDQLLMEMEKDYDYQVELIDKICDQGREISSTYIREEIEAGHMEKVKELLGDYYSVTGEVLHGNKIGRTIGMPTVNLTPPDGKILPPNGVYYSEVHWKENSYQGITNIGYKPTVSTEKILGVETYLYNFVEHIYGEQIVVKLLRYKRPEMKFESLEELKRQMQKDIEEGKKENYS